MDKKVVSVIVPIFYGKHYIPSILSQIEASSDNLKEVTDIELLLMNDAPCDAIDEEIVSTKIDVFIYNTNYNRGIHGTRVWGLQQCHGDFVLFLDQDDKIVPEYFKSQLMEIGEADCVVCRCINEKKQLYNEDCIFEKAITKEYMLTKGCPIVSPGQVLIRKTSIPKVWQSNIMQTNCADDFFLWLCMVANNCNFALNQNILFEHVVDGKNVSIDFNHMMMSEKEMFEILSVKKVFSETDLEKISAMLQKKTHDRIALLVKFRKMFMLLNQMVICQERGCAIGKYIFDMGIRKVAIYGDGYLGKRLLEDLQKNSVEVVFFIDRNADYLEEKIPVYKLENAPLEVDAVIISMVQNYQSVKEKCEEKYNSRVYVIEEILAGIGGLE